MTQGVIKEDRTPRIYTEAPFWMTHVMNNTKAYGDFYLDLSNSIQRCESQIADFLSGDKSEEAKIMLGKREALLELRFILEAYAKEERNAG